MGSHLAKLEGPLKFGRFCPPPFSLFLFVPPPRPWPVSISLLSLQKEKKEKNKWVDRLVLHGEMEVVHVPMRTRSRLIILADDLVRSWNRSGSAAACTDDMYVCCAPTFLLLPFLLDARRCICTIIMTHVRSNYTPENGVAGSYMIFRSG